MTSTDTRSVDGAHRVTRSFTIEGKPVPHVRMTQRGKHVKRQAQRYLAYKDLVGWSYRERYPDSDLLHAPLILQVDVHLADPDKRRWDASNVLKAIEDGLNEVAYVDDRFIDQSAVTVLPSEDDTDYVRVFLTGDSEQEASR